MATKTPTVVISAEINIHSCWLARCGESTMSARTAAIPNKTALRMVTTLSGYSFRLPFRHDDRPTRIQRTPARKGLVGDTPF